MSLTEFDQELFDMNRRREGAEEKAVETAKNLLKMKLGSIEQISQATGLPVEQVQTISTEMQKS